jgi:hypothetical protein
MKDTAMNFKPQIPPRRGLTLSGPASPINQFVIWFFLNLTPDVPSGEDLAKST